jgi:DUF4097 and DUF4098 domain-containing protein YvlB
MRIAITGALVLGLALPAAAERRVDERRPAAKDAQVSIENLSGSIKIVGWSKEEVAVSGTLGVGAEDLSFTGDPHRLQIEVEAERNPHGVNSDLEIHVPTGSRLEVESFNAPITATEISGSLRAESVNGSITVTGAPENVDAQAVSGSVTISGVTRRTHGESVNGSVTLKDVKGEVEGTTVNGTLTVSGSTFARCHMETVSGPARFDGALDARAVLDIESVSGAIELVLPATQAADFTVSTFSGSIDNALGPPAQKKSKYTPEKEVEFSTGSGGARVSLRTLSGSITIKKR